MKNRWADALIKTLIVLAVVHVIILIPGFIWGEQFGFFNIRMYWAHWHNWGYAVTSIILALLVYWLIYIFWPAKDE